ncbi:uncharacterized protein METZ01_LOCUS417176, partial [marine metagenome]
VWFDRLTTNGEVQVIPFVVSLSKDPLPRHYIVETRGPNSPSPVPCGVG